MARVGRASAAAAARRISAQVDYESSSEPLKSRRKRRHSSPSSSSEGYNSGGDAEESSNNGDDTKSVADELSPPPKRRRPAASKSTQKKQQKTISTDFQETLFSGNEKPIATPCLPPTRRHDKNYHRPLLLDASQGRVARSSLLRWYDVTSDARGMPWRKPFLGEVSPPKDEHDSKEDLSRTPLAIRAYEVWVSEIMAQQTRIPVVVDYWTRWIRRWPTVADLAAAHPDDVLAQWRGLGYYSRAARLHAGAKAVVEDMRGLLPSDIIALQKSVPGVGRYTAGAIAAIVFGMPAAMVDGNVVRVLSRQLGLYADAKDKTTMDVLWAAADALVQAVAGDGDGGDDSNKENDNKQNPSDRPGRWGQALMELGSTVCTPTPNCSACPIRTTCRAYAEGALLTDPRKPEPESPLLDIEDADTSCCSLCDPFPDAGGGVKVAVASKTKSKSPFFASSDPKEGGVCDGPERLAAIVDHAKQFPLRRPKKAVRQVTTLVCAIRAADGRYLLHRRPAKGLLAGMWELPSYDLPGDAGTASSPAARRKEAAAFVVKSLRCGTDKEDGLLKTVQTKDIKSLETVPWLFSHIKQTMYVFIF